MSQVDEHLVADPNGQSDDSTTAALGRGDDQPSGQRICCRHHAEGGDSLGEHDDRNDAICVNHVSYQYDPGVDVLRDVTLHIPIGCNLGVIGPNGGGKTTLLKMILGLLDCPTGTGNKVETVDQTAASSSDDRKTAATDIGQIRIMGLTPKEVLQRGNIIGYVPQQHEFEKRFPINVRQVIRMGQRHGRWLATAQQRQTIEQLMVAVGVESLADRPIGQLSGGQQQRVLIARALACEPKILLLDEPMVGVDWAGQKQFADLIHQLHATFDLTIVIVSHDMRTVAACCDRVACLAKTVHYHDSPAGLTPDILREVFEHDIGPIFDQIVHKVPS